MTVRKKKAPKLFRRIPTKNGANIDADTGAATT